MTTEFKAREFGILLNVPMHDDVGQRFYPAIELSEMPKGTPYYHFIEKAAYQKAVDSLKNISKFEYCDEERGKSGFTTEALNAQKTLKELGEL